MLFCRTVVHKISLKRGHSMATNGLPANTHTQTHTHLNETTLKTNNQDEKTTHDKMESDLEMQAKEIPAELRSPDREVDSSPPRSEILLTLVRE